MSRFSNPVPQYFDNEGNLLSGGKIFFYENKNYSSLKDTFSQSDNTIANTNPLILDGEGRVPPCFGDGLYSAKLYKTDDNGNTVELIWTRDDVSLEEIRGEFSLWVPVKTYTINSIAKDPSDGDYYQLFGASTSKGEQPSATPTKWERILFITVYNPNRSYDEDNIVESGGFLFRSTQNGNTDTPPSAKWANLTFNDSVSGNFSVGGNLTVTGSTTTASVSSSGAIAAAGILSGSNLVSGGSFTPTIIGTTAAGVGTYSVQYGNYSRVGNFVIGSISLSWTAHTGTGNIRIDGLPVVASSPGEDKAGGISVIFSALLTYGAGKQLTGIIQHNTQNILLYAIESNAVEAAVAIDSAAAISLTFMYRVAP